MKIYLVILITISILAMAACGGASEGASSPTEAVKTYTAGINEKDPAKVRSVMTKSSVEKMETALKGQNTTFDDYVKSGKIGEAMKGEAEYGKENINGDKATVEVTTGGKTETLNLVKEDGAWKVALM